MSRLTTGSRLTAALLLILTGLAAGCNDSTTTPTSPTNPITDTLTGTITPNGASIQPFNATAAGKVTATITTLVPSSATVGFAMGTYNGTTCQIVQDNVAGVQGSILTATAQTAGSFCVRLYDPHSSITASVNFTVTVVHF